MTWRAVMIAAPQYVFEDEQGNILGERDGSPRIRYSLEQAEKVLSYMNGDTVPFAPFPAPDLDEHDSGWPDPTQGGKRS